MCKVGKLYISSTSSEMPGPTRAARCARMAAISSSSESDIAIYCSVILPWVIKAQLGVCRMSNLYEINPVTV